MKIINYTLVSSTNQTTLCEAVRRLINEGWQPQGGIAHCYSSSTYLQAMVKYESE